MDRSLSRCPTILKGKRVLPNELVAGLCLDWLGVAHPRPAVVDLPAELLAASPQAVFADGTPLAEGAAFGSELWQSDPQGTVSVDLIENTRDVAGTLVLDTWIQMFDGRQYRVRASSDVPGRYEFLPVDQGFAFGSPDWTAETLAAAPDPAVAASIKPLTNTDVQPFIDRLSSFGRPDAVKIVSQLPADWASESERSALVDYLMSRASKAASALSAHFPPEQGGQS